MISFIRFWWAIPIVGLSIALTLSLGRVGHWKNQAALERAAHERTVLSYRAAAEKAKALDLANVIRVQAERKASDQKAMESYETRLADSNARYDRLRRQAEAYRSDPANKNLSASMDATCQAFGAADCDGVLAKMKAAQDNTDQLIALQEAVKRQGAITP